MAARAPQRESYDPSGQAQAERAGTGSRRPSSFES
jgi:hypothetical protein